MQTPRRVYYMYKICGRAVASSPPRRGGSSLRGRRHNENNSGAEQRSSERACEYYSVFLRGGRGGGYGIPPPPPRDLLLPPLYSRVRRAAGIKRARQCGMIICTMGERAFFGFFNYYSYGQVCRFSCKNISR